MKNIKILVLGLLSLYIFACEGPDPLGDINADLSNNQGNPYVIVDASSAVLDNTTTQSLTVELPTSIAGNVTVNFNVAGSAVEGQDYTLSTPTGVSISAGSGTGEIVFNITQGGADGFDLTVETAGEAASIGKTIEVSLTGATAADGRIIDLGPLNAGSAVSMTIADPE